MGRTYLLLSQPEPVTSLRVVNLFDAYQVSHRCLNCATGQIDQNASPNPSDMCLVEFQPNRHPYIHFSQEVAVLDVDPPGLPWTST